MTTPIKLCTFRYKDAPKRGEGLRIGTTRRPPRGATKAEWGESFDVWFPILAPSAALLARFRGRGFDDLTVRQRFFGSYERELYSRAEPRQALQLLAHLALRTPISIGCFCEDESRCHRSYLRKLIEREACNLNPSVISTKDAITEFSDKLQPDAHRRFQTWRREHPKGFFLNPASEKNTFTLHHVACWHHGNTGWHSADFDGATLTKKRKLCSTDYEALEMWAFKHGHKIRYCAHCVRVGSEAVPFLTCR